MRIFVVGSLNMDLVINAPYVPDSGVTISGSGFLCNPGGKGANQAAAVGKLGGEAYLVGCVGKAFGEELVGALSDSRVHTEFIERHPEVSSGIAVILIVEGDNRIILDPGANACLNTALLDKALATAKRGDYLVAQLETDMGCVNYALKSARAGGMVTVLNPAPAKPLEEQVFSLCDYFVPNQSEAEFYTGIYPDSEQAVQRCAGALLERGVKNVLITLGARGAYLCGQAGSFMVESVRVRAVDTTAAGDTYVGAFVTGLSEGRGVREAMEFAARAAAVTVTRRGAQQAIPYRSELEG